MIMRKFLPLLLLILSGHTLASELRCGWLQNPSPANQWLTDKDGTWDISLQGRYSALGGSNLKICQMTNMSKQMEIMDMGAPVSGGT